MSAKKEYIVSLLNFIDEKYGSIEGYCKTELGITDDYIKALKEKYLV